MNDVEIKNFFDEVADGSALSVKFKKSLTPIEKLNLNEQEVIGKADVWLNVKAVRNLRSPYGVTTDEKGVLISMTKTVETYYVYEKIVNDEDKSAKENTLVKDEVICKTYDNSTSAISAIIKSIKKYCPERAHEFIEFS